MAFNPFSAFHRNQKVWMAGILFVCMITFIFCGMQSGDLSDQILRRLQGRGTPIMYVDRTAVTRETLDKLREQRNNVNEYMHKCAEACLDRITKSRKELEGKINSEQTDRDKRRQDLAYLLASQGTLVERLSKGRYFDLGTKFDDLVEFKLWQAQAQHLGINLTEDDVIGTLFAEFFGLLKVEELEMITREVRISQHGTGMLMRGLTDEFNVRLAQKAVMEAEPVSFLLRQKFGDYRFSNPNMPTQVRAPLTLAQFWDFYKSKRSQFDVTLVPVHVSDFVKEVPEPTEADQKAFFEQHKRNRYDPTSDKWGLEIPAKMRVAFLMADPTSKAYKSAARAKAVLETLSPLLGFPAQSPLVRLARYGGAVAAKERVLGDAYERLVSQPRYRTAPLWAADSLSPVSFHLAEKQPAAIASLVASLAQVETPLVHDFAYGAFGSWGAVKHPDLLAAAAVAENRRRAEVYAPLLANSLVDMPLLAAFGWAMLADEGDRITLPLAVVEEEIQELLDAKLASTWASDNIQKVKQELDRNLERISKDTTNANKAAAFRRVLGDAIPKYHLTFGETKKAYDRFQLSEAKELEPLAESYKKYYEMINYFEGRDARPERKLGEKDFYKMFFEGEPWAARDPYIVRTWPPVLSPSSLQMKFNPFPPAGVTRELKQEFDKFLQQQNPIRPTGSFDLFTSAEKPILMWKIDDERARDPDKLETVRDRVIEGFKFEKAREDVALKRARAIADEMVKTKGSFSDVQVIEAHKLGRKLIDLRDISPLVLEPGQFNMSYGPYRLPRGELDYPRDDMASQVLELYDPKKPVRIEQKDLDAINQALFDAVKKEKEPQGKYVQIFTNKPRSVYYVAAVSKPPSAFKHGFYEALQLAPTLSRMKRAEEFASQGQMELAHRFAMSDPLMVLAQEQAAKELRQRLVDQMRQQFGVEGDFSEARKNFDGNLGS